MEDLYILQQKIIIYAICNKLNKYLETPLQSVSPITVVVMTVWGLGPVTGSESFGKRKLEKKVVVFPFSN